MDVLWSPWRYDYITENATRLSAENNGCVFCAILESSADDEEKFIIHRAEHNFIILNIYPYITGHLMVVPFKHQAEIDRFDKEITDEMMDLTKNCQTVLRAVYNPNGFNIGINIGKTAGAGVAGHLHQHILPRWLGDANFMTTIGQTRTIPEDLRTTYNKLKSQYLTSDF